MRPKPMPRFLPIAALLSLLAAYAVSAQTVVGQDERHPATRVRDSSMLKPPDGAKIAIIDWTDLECPACAKAFPVVHAAIAQYKIPLVHYDYLIHGHPWSAQAAVFARYLQDKVSRDISTEYRREVFASQQHIAGPDDLDRFDRQFMATQNKPMPFVLDATGQFRKEIDADCDLGTKMGLAHTPSIFVVTATHWIEVADVMDLDTAIGQAKAELAAKSVSASRAEAAKKQD